MIILEIRLLRIKLPLITPYRLSYRTVEAFEPLLVEVRDADGNAGWGEGHISPGSSDETPEGGWAFCHNIAATAAGHDSDAIKASLLDSMAVSPVAAGAFVSAIDMLTGDPLLRPPAEETRLPILAPVNGLTPEALGPEIEEKLASGFRTFKIKVGKDLDGDIARTRTIQDTIAGRATMRIDANRAFSEDQAKQFAAALNPEGIELFEQPCDAEDWDANAAVAGMSPVPVMLDEPICAIADIERAAKIVGAHDFIARLDGGYETMLQQQGRNLSLGQRQLISFARALVADARILVLDEATANIDSYTERQIQIGLARLLEGRTGIVIAHRLATIRGADRIIVLREGRIVETGTHDALLGEGGLYATLYALNYASFDDIPGDVIRDALAAPVRT